MPVRQAASEWIEHGEFKEACPYVVDGFLDVIGEELPEKIARGDMEAMIRFLELNGRSVASY